jgi:hypothetical protein
MIHLMIIDLVNCGAMQYDCLLFCSSAFDAALELGEMGIVPANFKVKSGLQDRDLQGSLEWRDTNFTPLGYRYKGIIAISNCLFITFRLFPVETREFWRVLVVCYSTLVVKNYLFTPDSCWT